ncbi:MAG: hypothetical protein AAGF99_08310 [Bacteroidota bacterium]
MTASTFAAALANRLLAGLPSGQPLTRALMAGLPEPIAHYLERWLAQHVGRVEHTLASPWVEDTEEVAATRRALVAAMQRDAQVPVERRDQVVRYVVGRIVSHLVRPGDALVKTVEETGAGPYAADAIMARLGWFTNHAALAEVVASYFDWKGTDALSADELRRLVRQIDQRLAQEESPSEWIGHLAPLFDLADVLGGRRVPAALVRAHLDARNLGTGALFGVEADHALSEAELLAMLQDEPLTVPVSIDIEDDDPGFGAAPPEATRPQETATSSIPAEEDEPTSEAAPYDETAAPIEAEEEAPATDAVAIDAVATDPDEPADASSEEPASPLLTSKEVAPDSEMDEEPADSLRVTPAPGIAPPFVLRTNVEDTPEDRASTPDGASTKEAEGEKAQSDERESRALASDSDPSETAPDRHLAPISDALDALAPADSDDTPEPTEPEASADAATPDGPPTTIEEATRDDQPLWTRYAAPPTPSVNDQFATPEEASASAPEEGDDDVPLWRRFFTGGDSGPTVPETEAEEPTGVFSDEPVPSETVPVETATSDPDDIAALEKRLLGPAAEQRSWFVAQLTEGDEDAYDATLRALDAAQSWTEASQIIARDIFRRYRVNIYSAPAIAFTDAVETHFRTQRA